MHASHSPHHHRQLALVVKAQEPALALLAAPLEAQEQALAVAQVVLV
jgi:hypothetical protein